MLHKGFLKRSSIAGISLAAAITATSIAAAQGETITQQTAMQACEPIALSVMVIPASKSAELPPIPDRYFAKSYTDAELEMMALVIYQEAGGDACTDETRLMVGQVVLNRVSDSRFPDTIEEVLLQKSQYGRLHWTGLVWPERASNESESEAVERAYKCAEMVLNGEKLLPDDCVWQAEFVQGKEIVAQSDGFYFCR